MLGTSEEQARARAGLADAPGARSHTRTGILADRIAATLTSHEPGWRLPQLSQLARRHDVSTDEAAAAIDHLVARQLVRRAPDGRLYRAGPADYLVSVENMAGLSALVDSMGRELTCLSYTAELRPAPEKAACALGLHGDDPVGVLRLAWALDGLPAATSTTYLAAGLPEPLAVAGWVTGAAEHETMPMHPAPVGNDDRCRDVRPRPAARAVAIEMDLPPVSVARRLRLAPGQMAVLVTALFGNWPGHPPDALTTAVLRPDMFRITVDTAAHEAGGQGLRAEWSLAAWDPAR